MNVSSFLPKKLIKVIFHIFNMASKMAANDHVTIFIIIGSNEFLATFYESFIAIG